MNELERERKLSTADVAAAARRPEREADPSITASKPEPPETAQSVPIALEAPPHAEPEQHAEMSALFAGAEADGLRAEWDVIQIAFVDEPRRSVERADELVARTIQRLAEVFAQERAGLEAQWSRGDEVSTEDLRLALQRYRSFFGRLLAV